MKGHSMKRREFIARGLPVAAGGALLAGCSGGDSAPAVVTRPKVNWRMTSSYTRGLDVLFGAAEWFVNRVSELSDGNFRIRLYPAGEIVPGNQVFDAVQQGTVQCGQTASYYYTGKHEAFAFDTGVPFGLSTRQQFAWLNRAGGLELLNEIYADFNILAFSAGSTGAQMGGWFRREINSINDLSGLKMRIPGLGGEVMSRMKVTVQLLSGAEVYMALERGVIDAVEWVGPHDDEKLGFHKICKNYYYPGWWEPGATVSHYVNRQAWEKLPAEYQAAVAVASAEVSMWMTNEYDVKNPQALQRLLASGTRLHKFPDDVMQEARRITNELLEQKSAADASYRKVYEHWKAFRDQSNPWFAVAELPMTEVIYR